MASDLSQSVIIRKVQSGDVEACRHLWRELTEWHREIYADPTIGGRHPEDFFDQHLSKVGPDRLWVAVCDSQVVGLTGLICEGEEAEVEPLIVSEASRGKGIGQMLIEQAVSAAQEIGVRYLSIKPVARNKKAIRWLFKQGFTNLGHIELFMSLSTNKWEPGLEIHGCKFNM